VSNMQAATTLLIGAVIGGIAGYLFFTDHGRTLRRRIDPALDDVARQLTRFRAAMHKTTDVASTGWNMLTEAIGGRGQKPHRDAAPRQSSPF
jgi:gas vesicle protein